MKAPSKTRCIFSIFYILLLWGFEKLYAQDTLLAKISNDGMSIKAKLDSIRDRLKKDTVSSELIFFNIDFVQKNAYGCILVKDNKRIKGNKIEVIDNIEHVYPLTKKLIELDSKILNELFSYPDNFIKNFFPMETHSISHDNEVYFFLKVNGKILFDRYFMRSTFIDSQNEKAKKIVIRLGAISSSY